jgi:tetratricopeptide (TPR) repeat protein
LGSRSFLIGVVMAAALGAAAEPPDRIDRVERWLKALLHHQVGSLDDAAVDVASWSDEDLSTLWTDLRSLTLLMRKPGQELMENPRGARQRAPLYTRTQARHLNVLACAAAAIATTDAECLARKAVASLDDDLRRLMQLVAEGRGVGADNYVLKYGALLHTDIAMFVPDSASPFAPKGAGPQRFRVEMSDGLPTHLRQSAAHWDVGRMLLDAVRPTRSDKPSPGRDPMVRDWYRATSAWMQAYTHYDSQHVGHGCELFPNDRDLLFLCATHHEVYAAPRIQSVVKTVTLPSGFSMDAAGDRDELRQARSFFRRAVAVDPDFAEAHLRLGRVLALEREPAEALRELTLATAGLTDEPNRYYRHLFLGAVEESMARYDDAREAFTEAARLFPTAQSPLIALTELARRRGDRRDALRLVQRVFDLPEVDRDDPWWTYDRWQARNANQWIEDLQQPFAVQ